MIDIDTYLILNNKKYSNIFKTNYILMAIILLIIYIIFTYEYQTYYLIKGVMINNQLVLIPFNQNEMRNDSTMDLI